MATTDFTSGSVMDGAAALLNDVGKSLYTYEVQLPYINMAMRELEQHYALNEIPATTSKSSEIVVEAGRTEIVFNAVFPAPSLPSDLVEPQQLWEGYDGKYTPMTRLTQLPSYLEGLEVNMFIYWAWNGQEIKLPAANTQITVKIDYSSALFSTILDENNFIGVINGQSFLEFRTAALCAKYIGENPQRADSLNMDAALAMDKLIGISSKGRQSIVVRRRPFRGSYKARGF